MLFVVSRVSGDLPSPVYSNFFTCVWWEPVATLSCHDLGVQELAYNGQAALAAVPSQWAMSILHLSS